MKEPGDRRHLMLVALGYLSGLLMLSQSRGWLVPLVPWGALGGVMMALLLPTAAAVNYQVFRRVGRTPDQSSAGAIREIGYRITLFEIVLHILILAGLTGLLGGNSMLPARLVVVCFGVLLIGIGDQLPRTRPNLAVGIRTPRMLSDRHVWIGVHRTAGYAAVGLGAVVVFAGTFLGHPQIAQAINAALLVALSVTAWSYRRFTRPRVAP